MGKTARVIGWACFVVALIVYLAATCFFAIAFAGSIPPEQEGEEVGRALFMMLFLVFGSILYGVCSVLSGIAAVVANVNRGTRKFFFLPIVTLVLSVLTWIAFVVIGILL